MTPSEIKLDLLITDKDADAEQLDELTVRLMRDLRELGAESVERSPGEDVPDGAKGDAFTVGALALVAVPAVLPSLVNFLQSWSLRGESRRVKIKTATVEIEFTPDKKMSQQDMVTLVERLTTGTEDAGGDTESSPLTLSYRTQLRQLLSKHFDKGELETLCFDLGMDYDSLPGDDKADKERELLEHLERRGRVRELVALGKRLRPDVPWDSLPGPSFQVPKTSSKPPTDKPSAEPATPVAVEKRGPKDVERSRSRLVLQRGKPMPWLWVAAAGLAALVVIALLFLLTRGSGVTAPPSSAKLNDIWTRPTDGMVMVYVPSGTFEMGSVEGDDREQPVHSVTLDSFWIDKYEVTNTQYRKCVEGGACEAPTTCDWGKPTYEDASKADHPVVCVDWDGANAYCEWAEARLPTEAEWEYAARGREGSVYPWGDEFDCSRGNFGDETQLDEYVVPSGAGCDGFDRTAPVGSFEAGASWCEALDMAGNLWEWVNDWYQYDYYAVSPESNPPGPETGDYKVQRGGSWGDVAYDIRSAGRGGGLPHGTDSSWGFRCVAASTP